jgi:hypothetical protein
MQLDIQKARREELRWLILLALNAARPIGTSEVVVKNAIEPVILDVTVIEIRNELDYLSERGLVALECKDSLVWTAKLNRYGIDVVEYTIPCDAGIKRPSQWGR